MTLCVAVPENSSPLPQAFNSSLQAFRCYAKPLSPLNNSQRGKVPCLPLLLLGIVLVMTEYSTFLWTATTFEGTLGNHSQQGHWMASIPGRCITLPGPAAHSPCWAPSTSTQTEHTGRTMGLCTPKRSKEQTGSPRWEHHSKYHLPKVWRTSLHGVIF